MILCVTPNPAVDRTLLVAGLQPGGVHRATRTIVAAGGKGLNVARAVKTLGGQPLAMGLLGGYSGRLVADLAQAEGIAAHWTPFDGETRTCVIVVPEVGEVTVINETGPTVTPADWLRLVDDVLAQVAQADAVCLCGSLPPGVPVGAPADLIEAVAAAGKPFWVDSSGQPLGNAILARPTGLKVNSLEAGELLNMVIDGPEAAVAAAHHFLQKGIRTVALTLGRQGAVLVSETGQYHAWPPEVAAVSNVGSGDCFLAGLLTALALGHPPVQALSWAVAAGTANTLSPGGGRFALADFQRILTQVRHG
ncbi:MAG TPA: 1-phosphofructokinase family hexose kinase [Anaerolineae bacterium]